MAAKKPQVRADVQLGDDLALVELAARFVDLDDAVDHQHVGQGQAGIAGAEELALAAGDQFFLGVAVLGGERGHVSPWNGRAGRRADGPEGHGAPLCGSVRRRGRFQWKPSMLCANCPFLMNQGVLPGFCCSVAGPKDACRAAPLSNRTGSRRPSSDDCVTPA